MKFNVNGMFLLLKYRQLRLCNESLFSSHKFCSFRVCVCVSTALKWRDSSAVLFLAEQAARVLGCSYIFSRHLLILSPWERLCNFVPFSHSEWCGADWSNPICPTCSVCFPLEAVAGGNILKIKNLLGIIIMAMGETRWSPLFFCCDLMNSETHTHSPCCSLKAA